MEVKEDNLDVYGEPVKAQFHQPDEPRYSSLIQMMKPIIPKAFPKPRTMPEDPNIQVVRSILNTTKEMHQKLDGIDPQRKALLEGVIQLAHKILSEHYSTGRSIPEVDRDKLLKMFAEALNGTDDSGPKTKAKAPFAQLGEDGFEDVDHQILAMEIKRLAMSLTGYLKERMEESLVTTKSGADLNDPSVRVKFETDTVLTQSVAIIAKLHRAILRNHHHILLLIGNFAGNTNLNENTEHEEEVATEKVEAGPAEEDNIIGHEDGNGTIENYENNEQKGDTGDASKKELEEEDYGETTRKENQIVA